MARCQNCRHEFRAHGTGPLLCPRCGTEYLPDREKSGWACVARLTNLAEVGYFADMLEGKGISTNVLQHNEFSALDGSWSTVFILRVSEDCAAAAAEFLQMELQSSPETESWAPDLGDCGTTSVAAAAVWKPVVWVLVAGGLAYCAGRTGMVAGGHAPRPNNPLWQVLRDSPRPLVNDVHPGEPSRRLRYDAPTGTVLLEEDADGDGRFEPLSRFRDPER